MRAFALLVIIVATSCGRPGSPERGESQAAVVEPLPILDSRAATPNASQIDQPASVPTPAGIEIPSSPIAAVENATGRTAPRPSLVATVVVPEISVFRHPGGQDEVASFSERGTYGEPRVFLVREARERWLRVLLPMRPNGAEGWISSGDVRLSRHRFTGRVDLSERRLTVIRGANVILRRRVSIGQPESPTPTGLFFTTVVVRAPDPAGPYGPLAIGLSGFSDVYTEFNGGPGQIAIHGTNAPHLIGQDVSAGCVRMRNEDVLRVADLLPLGTPVRIVR